MKKTKQERVLKGKRQNLSEEGDNSPRSSAVESVNHSHGRKDFVIDDLEFEVDEPINQLKQDLDRLAAEEDDSEEAFQQELEQYKLPKEAQRHISSAKKDIETNQSLSSRFRAELEQYVTFMEEKTSDIDGEKLIKIPKNFETIVNAMTKEDLFDGEEGFGETDQGKTKSKGSGDAKASQQHRPPLPNKATGVAGRFLSQQQLKKDNRQAWYRYLMEDYVNRDMNDEHDGRYSNLLLNPSAEEKVKKGLAEILLLDRELFHLSKKAELVFPDATPRHSSDAGDVPYTPKSSASSRPDRTFITKNNASRSFSNATSPRTAASSKISSSTKKTEQKTGETVEGDSDEEKEGTSMSLNKRLTEEQQKRVSELLQLDDDDLASHLPYLATEEAQLDAEVTDRLKQYGHLDRLSEETENGGVVTYSEGKRRKIVTKIYTKDDGNDYLRQMREERKEKENEKRIDTLLSSLNQNREADYRHFFDSDENDDDRQSIQSRSQFNHSLHEVPLISQVRLDVPIKKEDIDALVAGLKKQLSLPSAPSSRPNTTSSLNSYSTLVIGEEDLHDGSTHLPSPSSSVQLARREEIQQLLTSLQTETQRLQLYRSKHLDSVKQVDSSGIIMDEKNEERQEQEEKDLEIVVERPFSPSDFKLIPSYLRLQPPVDAVGSRLDQIQLRVPESNRQLLFPPIKSIEAPREPVESSNPYATNRRIKAKQPSSTFHYDSESPRQRILHRFLSSRGSEPEVEASEEADNMYEEEGEEDFEVEGGDDSDNDDIRARKRLLVEKVRQFVEI